LYKIVRKLLTINKHLAQKVYAELVLKISNKKDLLEWLPLIKKKLKAKKIKIDKRIDKNKGSFGVVYSTPETGSVMKITTDKIEAETSAKLKGKKFKHIVKIDKVFKLKNINGVYFIQQEQLKKIPRTLAKIISEDVILESSDKIPEYKKLVKKFKKYGSNWSGFVSDDNSFDYSANDTQKKQEIIDYLWPYLVRRLPLVAGFLIYTFDKNLAENIKFPKTEKGLKFLNEALEGLEEMNANGISFSDTHGGNLMQNNEGVLKWVDIGHGSKAAGKGKIELIAKYGSKKISSLKFRKDVKWQV